MPTWNVDVTVTKDLKFTERISSTLHFQITNVFNHFQASDPSGSNASIDTAASFGRINAQANTPRKIEFGIRVFF
jgi:hypothetical protein